MQEPGPPDGGQIWGGLKFEAKFGHGSRGTRTRERLHLQGPAATVNYRPVLSSERTHHKIKSSSVRRELQGRRGEKLVTGLRLWPD
jgi:hypothetical protein